MLMMFIKKNLILCILLGVMLSILFGPIIIKFVLWLVFRCDITTKVKENPAEGGFHTTPPPTQLKMSYPPPLDQISYLPSHPSPGLHTPRPHFQFQALSLQTTFFVLLLNIFFLFFATLTGAFTVFEVVARFFGPKITICQKIRFQCKGKLFTKFRLFLNLNGVLPSKRATTIV